MQKNALTLSFLCATIIATTTSSLLCTSTSQKFINAVQTYVQQQTLNKNYSNPTQLSELASLIPEAQQELVKEAADQAAHVAQQTQEINKSPGTRANLEAAAQAATTNLASAKTSNDPTQMAQCNLAIAQANEGMASRDVYDARLTLEKAFCNSRDASPLKSAIAQAQALLNPNDIGLQDAADQAVKDSTKAAADLKTAEAELDAQWAVLKQKTAAVQHALKPSTQ